MGVMGPISYVTELDYDLYFYIKAFVIALKFVTINWALLQLAAWLIFTNFLYCWLKGIGSFKEFKNH